MRADGPLRLERSGDGVARCTLTRPPLNLLDPTVIHAVRETFTVLADDHRVRLAVLSGSGRAFSAGMDVRVLHDLDVAGARTLITSLHQAIEAVHHAPFPVIAAIDGPSLGAGLELALACDLRVASTAAVFGLPEVRVGVPSVIEAALLPGLLGAGRAAELLLTGQPIDAQQALAWGLINRVVVAAAMPATLDEFTANILAAGPAAIRLQKELMLRWRYTDLAGAIHAGIDAFARAYTTGEPAEGARAFLEKRPAKFSELA